MRGTSAQRGYDARWQALSAATIRAHPWCSRCMALGNVTNPLTTDHVVPKSRGGTDDPSNLQVLCKRCNASKGGRR